LHLEPGGLRLTRPPDLVDATYIPGRVDPPNEASSVSQASQRRVQAVVALKLLEVLRDRDLPGELLEDEDPAQTIPRRFGLSDVVDRQIRTFREEARRGVRIFDREIGDLFRFVIRRPDSDKVFRDVGRLLAAEDHTGRWPRALPVRMRFAVARRRTRARLRKLFGRPMGTFVPGAFVLEGRSLFFMRSDPGGDACHLISGLCEQVLAHTVGGTPSIAHTLCESTGDELCRWEGALDAPPATAVEPPAGEEAEPDPEDEDAGPDPEHEEARTGVGMRAGVPTSGERSVDGPQSGAPEDWDAAGERRAVPESRDAGGEPHAVPEEWDADGDRSAVPDEQADREPSPAHVPGRLPAAAPQSVEPQAVEARSGGDGVAAAGEDGLAGRPTAASEEARPTA